jgi:hypothetical protein
MTNEELDNIVLEKIRNGEGVSSIEFMNWYDSMLIEIEK